MIKIKFYSFKCNIPYLNIFLNRILVDLDGDSGDFSGDSGGDSGDSGDSAVIPVIPGNRVTPGVECQYTFSLVCTANEMRKMYPKL